MRSIDTVKQEGYFINDSAVIAEATARTAKIVGAHYDAANIDQIISTCLDFKQKTTIKFF